VGRNIVERNAVWAEIIDVHRSVGFNLDRDPLLELGVLGRFEVDLFLQRIRAKYLHGLLPTLVVAANVEIIPVRSEVAVHVDKAETFLSLEQKGAVREASSPLSGCSLSAVSRNTPSVPKISAPWAPVKDNFQKSTSKRLVVTLSLTVARKSCVMMRSNGFAQPASKLHTWTKPAESQIRICDASSKAASKK
jgi:hypothetical protein